MLERLNLYELSLRGLFLLIQMLTNKMLRTNQTNQITKTQPVPNPISYFLHKEPENVHKFEVISNHFLELVAPFMVIMPFRFLRQVGGILQIVFQVEKSQKSIYFKMVVNYCFTKGGLNNKW